MAIIGGAGNPVGGSFTGPAEALEIYGNYATALSGGVIVSNATNPEVTLLDFTSGNYLFVGTLQGFMAEVSGNDIRFTLTFNGVTVAEILTSGDNQYLSRTIDAGLNVIIPAYTAVKLTAINLTAPYTNRTNYAVLVGEIFRD